MFLSFLSHFTVMSLTFDFHPYRSEEMKEHFNGSMEHRPQPREVTVEDQMQHAREYEAWKSAGNREGVNGDPSKVHGVKRLSSLYKLPYWKVRQSGSSDDL